LAKGNELLCKPTPPGDAPITGKVVCIFMHFLGGYIHRVPGTELDCDLRHPVQNPSTREWECAGYIPGSSQVKFDDYKTTAVYHVLLDHDAFLNTMVVEGVLVAAIGCDTREGLSWNGYISHPFWCTYAEVEDQMKIVHPEGFKRGRVVTTGIRRSGDDDGLTESFLRDVDLIPDWAKDADDLKATK
jgi:hypothetical protein